MTRFLRRTRGAVMVLAAVSMVAVMGLAALAIDVGYVFTARNQLQAGVDASALAGAAGLMTSQNLAIQQAMDFAGRNNCINQPVAVGAGDISFPNSSRIRVTSSRQLPLFFASALGIGRVTISAAATAELGSIIGT
ncbi:MAG TPA: pilus assembly protein TadG-related protein, partial [bacterium]|nr:pilus assembly protein TadG-related protein [bacterium]